jgi:hypothetical protein
MSTAYSRQKWLEHEILLVAASVESLGLRAEAAALGICANHARRIAGEILDMETIEEGVFIAPRKIDNMRPLLQVIPGDRV